MTDRSFDWTVLAVAAVLAIGVMVGLAVISRYIVLS
jgi:hypothetical protein